MDLLEALNVRVVGSGERTLVLGHGVGSDQSSWRSIVPFFRRDHRIVFYDLPFAGTVHPNHFDACRYATLDAYVEDLLSILDALGIHRCTYVGHSISASIGIIASINRPHLFTKLILVGFSPRFLNDHGYHGGYERADIELAFSAMQADYEAWVHGHAPRAVGADASEEAVGEFRRTQLQMRPDITVFVLRMALYMDLRGMLGRVTVPCSVIQTAEDVAVPTAVAIYVANHLRQSTLHMLNTRGHLPHLSAPNMLAPELRRALPPTA